MCESKLSERLARRLGETREEELVELVIELERLEPRSGPATLGRADRIGALKTAFQAVAEPVERGIREAGGETVDRAWINQTVKARVPKAAVPTLCELEAVRRVDLTDVLQLDEEE